MREEINSENIDIGKVEEITAMLDKMVVDGTSRIKIKMSDELDASEIIKEYHHGRCDINSPFACGTPFDLLNEED